MWQKVEFFLLLFLSSTRFLATSVLLIEKMSCVFKLRILFVSSLYFGF